jgi:hypothetical protein
VGTSHALALALKFMHQEVIDLILSDECHIGIEWNTPYMTPLEAKPETMPTPKGLINRPITWIERLLLSPRVWIRGGRVAASILQRLIKKGCSPLVTPITNWYMPFIEGSTINVNPYHQPHHDKKAHNINESNITLMDLVERYTCSTFERIPIGWPHACHRSRSRCIHGIHTLARTLAPNMASAAVRIFAQGCHPVYGRDSTIHQYLFTNPLFDRQVTSTLRMLLRS